MHWSDDFAKLILYYTYRTEPVIVMHWTCIVIIDEPSHCSFCSLYFEIPVYFSCMELLEASHSNWRKKKGRTKIWQPEV